MSHGTFATAINCIDGRVQEPVICWMKERFRVDYVDMITEPGADKLVAEGDEEAVAMMKRKIEISVQKHGSCAVAIAGHHDCAGNPVSEEEHRAQIRKGVETLRAGHPSLTIVGLWVNEDWEIEEIE